METLCCASEALVGPRVVFLTLWGNAKGVRLGYFLVPKKNVIDSKG